MIGRAAAFAAVCVLGVALASCKEETAPPLSSLKPKPLPEVAPGADAAGDRLHQIEPAKVYGRAAPEDAARIELAGEKVTVDGRAFDARGPDAAARLRALIGEGRPALLVPDADTFMAQVAALLAALDDGGVKVWLRHPAGKAAFPVVPSDEADFRRWLDEIAAGRVRVIHRADGYELQTNLGKLPGPDANGPTVPRRGGAWDVARLREALVALERRFDSETESCIVPSHGVELAAVAESLTAWYVADDEPLFAALCLVYARP